MVHRSRRVTAILSEAGFNLKLVTGQPSQGHGYIWIEAYSTEVDGSSRTYVVDAAGAVYVKPYAVVVREAVANPAGRAAQFYAKPDRRYYELQ